MSFPYTAKALDDFVSAVDISVELTANKFAHYVTSHICEWYLPYLLYGG